MTQLNIQFRDPVHLKGKINPALKQVPELPESSEEFLALAAGVKRAGFIRPLLVDQEERVIDDHSRSLLKVALRWQLKEVPVQICSTDAAPMLIIHSLAHVRHLSKSAIAYLAVPQLQPALDAAKQRRLENLRKGQQNPESALSADSGPVTMVELAEELQIGCRMLEMAIAVRKEFESKKVYTFSAPGTAEDGTEATFKDWYEPKLLRSFVGGEHENRRPVGLGGILAGIESKKLDPAACTPKKGGEQMELKLWEESFQPLTKVCPSWKGLSEQDRAAVLKHWQRTVNKMPDDLREAMADILEKSLKA